MEMNKEINKISEEIHDLTRKLDALKDKREILTKDRLYKIYKNRQRKLK